MHSGESSAPGSVVLFGDSVANGLGSRGRSYGRIVASELGCDLVDYSGSAMPVSQSVQILRELGVPQGTHIALVGHGITEAIVRPTKRALRYVPSRWRRPGWMDPRPYYSSNVTRRALQKLESSLRWRIKNFLIRKGGGYQMLPSELYEASLRTLLAGLRSRGVKLVLVVGPPDVDRKFFPGSREEVDRYAHIARRLAAEEGARFVEVSSLLHQPEDYLLDRFHPNEAGHAAIATRILSCLREREIR